MEKALLIINPKKLNNNIELLEKLNKAINTREIPSQDIYESTKTSSAILYQDNEIEKKDEEVIEYFNKYKPKIDFKKIVPINGANFHSSSFVPNYTVPIQVNLIKPHDESKDILYQSDGTFSRRIEGNLFAATRRMNNRFDVKRISTRNGSRDLRDKSMMMHQHITENTPYSVLKQNKGNRYEMQKETHKLADIKNQVYGLNLTNEVKLDDNIWD